MKFHPYSLLASSLLKRSNVTGWVYEEGIAPLAATDDEFYRFDAQNISRFALGDVLNIRDIGSSNFANISRGYQILYRSENTFGYPTATVTTLLIPRNFNGTNSSAPVNIVSYQFHEDASYLDCAPSYVVVGSEEEHARAIDKNVQALLNRGVVVNIPDHEGINSSFVAGPLEGKLTLDSIRAINAASNLTGINPGKVALWGYSGGSIASGWAAEFMPWYAPELNIITAAVGGFVVNLTATVELVNGTPFVGFVPPGIVGLANEYPGLWEILDEQLQPSRKEMFLKTERQCLGPNLMTYMNQDFYTYFKDYRDIIYLDEFQEVLANCTLGTAAPTIPMLVYQGISDQIVPIDGVDKVVESYCDNGTPVKFVRGESKDHPSMEASYDPIALKYILDAFNGDLPESCTVEGPAIGQYGNSTVPQPMRYNGTGNYTGFNNTTPRNNLTVANVASSSRSGSTSLGASATGSESAAGAESTATSASAAAATASGDAAVSSSTPNAGNMLGVANAVLIALAAVHLL